MAAALHPSLLLAFSLRDRLAAMSWLELVLWLGLASLTIALLILMGTRWGQVRPVSKCVALSVFAHILFLAYAYGTNLSFSGGWSGEPTVRISFVDAAEADAAADLAALPRTDAADLPPSLDLESPTPAPAEERTDPVVEVPTESPREATSDVASVPQPPPALLPPPPEPIEPDTSTPAVIVETPTTGNETAEMIAETEPPPSEAPPEIVPEPVQPVETPPATTVADAAPAEPNPPPETSTTAEAADESQSEPSAYETASAAPPATPVRPVDEQPVPAPYRLRVAENRLQLAIPFGATESSEAAVQAALVWLASVQSSDGRWDASDFGAGRETKTLGHDRQGAGADADMGITGLALLAMLGAGQSHLQGEHRETVKRGLEYLLRGQAADGNLAGPARLFERMYCHGIATLALGEAFSITGDPRLRPALQRAVGYTVASQHASSGGWRYQPGDRGDVSQFGWQVMALRSASLGGLPVDSRTRTLMTTFLQSATSGRQQGLVAYRPGERPSRTMTAEGMACRFFMETPPTSAAAREATEFIMQELPGQGQPNLYYWYYATLALFQDQGPAWPVWNESLQNWLVGRQRRDGRAAGSWDTDDVWGGYGGRIYTTAMGALCLEVYYRYLPLYELETTRQAEAVRVMEPVRR